PSASMGTKGPEAAELFADSGPATPATAPCANSSGRFESFRSAAYDTELEEGHDVRDDSRVVRRFRARHPGHRALPEFLGTLRELSLDRVRHEARDDVRRAGHDADQEAQHRAAPDGPR